MENNNMACPTCISLCMHGTVFDIKYLLVLCHVVMDWSSERELNPHSGCCRPVPTPFGHPNINVGGPGATRTRIEQFRRLVPYPLGYGTKIWSGIGESNS